MILLLQELVKQRKSNPLLTLTIYRGIVSYGISSKIYFSVASKMNQRQMKSWGRLLTKGLANFSKVIEIFKSLVTHDDIPKCSHFNSLSANPTKWSNVLRQFECV